MLKSTNTNNIAHASGGYGRDKYLNSTGNILYSISMGYENIEVDIMPSDDDKYVICLHNKKDFKKIFGFEKHDILLDQITFNLLSDSHPKYDFCNGNVLLDIFTSFPDVYLILDLKNNYESNISSMNRYHVLDIAAGVHHLNMNNVVPQIYDLNHDTVYYIESLGYNKFLLALQVMTKNNDFRSLSNDVIEYVNWLIVDDKLDMIHGISIPLNVVYDYKETLLNFLSANNIAYYPHTTNSIEEVSVLHMQLGIAGVYTDYLPPSLNMLRSDCVEALLINSLDINQINFDTEHLNIVNKSNDYCTLDGLLVLNANNYILFSFPDGSYIAPQSSINIVCDGKIDDFYSYVGQVSIYSHVPCGKNFLSITEGDSIIKLVSTLQNNSDSKLYSIVDTCFYSIVQYENSTIKLKYSCNDQNVIYSASPIPVDMPMLVDPAKFDFTRFNEGVLLGFIGGALFTGLVNVMSNNHDNTLSLIGISTENLVNSKGFIGGALFTGLVNVMSNNHDNTLSLIGISTESLIDNSTVYDQRFTSYLKNLILEHEFSFGVFIGFPLGISVTSIGCTIGSFCIDNSVTIPDELYNFINPANTELMLDIYKFQEL